MKITKNKLKKIIREAIEDLKEEEDWESHSKEEERIAKLLMHMKKLGYSETDLLKIWRGERAAGYEKPGGPPALGERELSKGEKTEREKLAKHYKPAMKSFKDQYGDRGEEVYYATMTKKAKQGEKTPKE
jgi:hypothetical protein